MSRRADVPEFLELLRKFRDIGTELVVKGGELERAGALPIPKELMEDVGITWQAVHKTLKEAGQ